MNYEILLSVLQGKSSEFESLKSTARNFTEECKSSLNNLSGTEINSIYNNLISSTDRLNNGYDKCNTWLSDYLNGLNTLESSLANFNSKNIDAPIEFNGEFIDMFGKKVIPTLKEGGDKESNIDLGKLGNSGLSSSELEKILSSAESQKGTPYWSMNYGPDGEGFGCAMFVSYCYNQALFDGVSGQEMDTPGFYGSTYEYWGNVTNDGYDPHNKGFVEVSADEAQPGDVVAYTEGSDPYSSFSSCTHVALYVGDGMIIGSTGVGNSGPGVVEGTVDSQAYGREPHYLRYVGTE